MTPIAITIGEPAGIGPDIVVQLLAKEPHLFSSEKTVVVGNTALLKARAKLLKVACDWERLNIVDIPLAAPCTPGQLNTDNARFVIDMLTFASENAVKKRFAAITTAPIHKGVINDAGFSFKGHTDFFSQHTQSHTVMMLMTHTLKVALLTDHIPLQKVSSAVNTENLTRCLNTLIHDFKNRLQIKSPRIVVCGLNPHAGEAGYLGLEEKNVITPVLDVFREQGHIIIGPIGADVAFTEQYRENADVILAMYHDQGLPVIKYSDFQGAINVTLGLPFIRTSVDHGTALDIAGTGRADTTSLRNALLFARNTLEHTA